MRASWPPRSVPARHSTLRARHVARSGVPAVLFERYADDVMLHCKTQTQARVVLDTIIKGLAQVGLELNLDKTRIVYCKDSNRNVSHEHDQPVHGPRAETG
jgi:hypothetical protein